MASSKPIILPDPSTYYKDVLKVWEDGKLVDYRRVTVKGQGYQWRRS